MDQELGLGSGRRGRDRAALAMLWGEAGLPGLGRWRIAGGKDVAGIAVVDPSWRWSDSRKCYSSWPQVLGWVNISGT